MVRWWEWETCFPKKGCFPQISHTAAIRPTMLADRLGAPLAPKRGRGQTSFPLAPHCRPSEEGEAWP